MEFVLVVALLVQQAVAIALFMLWVKASIENKHLRGVIMSWEEEETGYDINLYSRN